MNYSNLFDYLRSIGHPSISSFRQGLCYEEIGKLENDYKIQLPKSLKNLFTSLNGLSTEGKFFGEISISPNGIFLSLQTALDIFEENKIFDYWPQSYFPIATNGEGDYILVNLAPEIEEPSIYFYSPSNVDFVTIISIYDSESSMVESIIECYDKKAFYIDSGLLQVNFQHESKICQNINSKSEYWKLIL